MSQRDLKERTTPPMYLILTGIDSRLSIKASDETSHRRGAYSRTTVVARSSCWRPQESRKLDWR